MTIIKSDDGGEKVTIQIFFEDLNEKAQEEIRPFAESSINTNSPIATIEIEDED
jgi:hypothetical protein